MHLKIFIRSLIMVLLLSLTAAQAPAHIIPPENFHPVAEGYRRVNFLLKLNPIPWEIVRVDVNTIANHFDSVDPLKTKVYRQAMTELIDQVTLSEEPMDLQQRKEIAKKVFEASTKIVAQGIIFHLERGLESLEEYRIVVNELREARQIWASFEHEIKNTDSTAYIRLGQSWLELSGAVGNPGVLGVGTITPDIKLFEGESNKIIAYLSANFGEKFEVSGKIFQPLPVHSKTFQPNAKVPVKLPPEHNINKQVPRPRQLLNIATRGVDETETALIAVGDMAFDSAFIFGEPARSLSISCNTCHNKSITNPNFLIPGLSKYKGGMDVSNSFFAPHANNGVFDPLDIPDLRGIRFTAPYGRNGRIAGLREFIRNVIMHEFNGPEPDPVTLDAMIAYMNEFDFLPNSKLNPEGTLNDQASASAKKGEKIFNTPFEGMQQRSCATCHIPSNNFLDRRNHDIGTVSDSEPYSRDGSMDTPTLLGIKYTAPYFHDGSQASIGDVIKWFNKSFSLDLNKTEVQDLTAYVDTVGDGVDAYEDTSYYLDAEMEEFSFFLSAYEYLKEKGKSELIKITFQTIALEIKNHKWELQDLSFLPVMNQLADIMNEATTAIMQNDVEKVDLKVEEYRKLFDENVDNLK